MSRLFRLLKGVTLACLHVACVHAPRFLTAAVTPFLALAAAVWYLNRLSGAPWTQVTTTILFSCYVLAGVLCGLLRESRRIVAAGLVWLEQVTPRVLDAIIDPVIEQTPAAGREVGLDDLRSAWTRATAALVVPSPPASGVLSLLSRVANWLAQRLLRARAAALERFLADFEQDGRTHVTAESLKSYLQLKLLALARADARSRLAVVLWCGYPLTLLTMSIPLIVAWVWEGGA